MLVPAVSRKGQHDADGCAGGEELVEGAELVTDKFKFDGDLGKGGVTVAATMTQSSISVLRKILSRT